MSISKVSGFKVCDSCNLVIQHNKYYQYKDQHFCAFSSGCLDKIIDKKVKDNLVLKQVKSHKFNN